MRAILLTIIASLETISLSQSFITSSNSKSFLLRNHILHSHSNDAHPQLKSKDILITFDLDDTIFPIAPIIKDSNHALLQCIHQLGYQTVTEDSFIQSTKEIRSGLDKLGIQITYTDLRKRAIRMEMEKHCKNLNLNMDTIHRNNNISNEIYMTHVNQVYNVWEEERHASAERNLYPDAIHMLTSLQNTFFPPNYNLIIGAITNGKGNPLKMHNTLLPYFDFCVSGEDDNVFPHRKPHEHIYHIALQSFHHHRTLKRQNNNSNNNNNDDDDGSLSMNKMNDIEWDWIHVGDDLANDVGASAKCGAKAILADLSKEYGQTSSKRFDNTQEQQLKNQPSWSTATVKELEQRKVLNDQAEALISGRIHTLSELTDTVVQILKDVDVEENSVSLYET